MAILLGDQCQTCGVALRRNHREQALRFCSTRCRRARHNRTLYRSS